MSRNEVIGGAYKGSSVAACGGKACIVKFINKPLTSKTVERFEVINKDERKSAVSGITRGLIGGAIFGTAGIIGGALSAKNAVEYQIAIYFRDGKKCMIAVDQEIFEAIISNCL